MISKYGIYFTIIISLSRSIEIKKLRYAATATQKMQSFNYFINLLAYGLNGRRLIYGRESSGESNIAIINVISYLYSSLF